MFKLFSRAACSIAAILSANCHADQYLCVTEQATGFAYKYGTKDWQTATFKPDDKFIIKTMQTGTTYAYEITKFGDNRGAGYCKQPFNELGILRCDMFGGDLIFNRSNGRFLSSYLYGYYVVGLDTFKNEWDSDTPVMRIGKCSPF